MLNLYKLMFFISLISGTLIAVSSYSWLTMWIGLEINLLSIIPLMSSVKNTYPSESALKYFITQSMASVIFLFTIILSLNLFELFSLDFNLSLMMILNSALLTKMGAAPFHYWFPEIMEGLNWLNCLVMLTWQKIAPMILLMLNLNMFFFLSMIIIFCSVVSGILGMNQISLRKIMTYSSINHIGWMIASMFSFQNIWFIYFSIYSFISFNIIIILKYFNILYLKQLINSINNSKLIKLLFILNFLSLGGLPPFLGFFPKWLTINFLISKNFFSLSLIMILFTLMTLYFYLRVCFSTFVINTNEFILQTTSLNLGFLIIFLNFLSLTGLFICTFIFSFI